MDDHPASQPLVAESASVADGVVFGANVVVHEGVVIGAGVIIQENVVLGKLPLLSASSATRGEAPGALTIDAGARICSGAIIFAGSTIGAGSIIGDQAYIRERVVIGEESVIGRGSGVDPDVVIGDRVSIQSSVYVTAGTVIEDEVFIGPGAITTNDRLSGPLGGQLDGPTLCCGCRIGAGAVLLPGVRIGEKALVAAGAVVSGDVADGASHRRPCARTLSGRRAVVAAPDDLVVAGADADDNYWYADKLFDEVEVVCDRFGELLFTARLTDVLIPTGHLGVVGANVVEHRLVVRKLANWAPSLSSSPT